MDGVVYVDDLPVLESPFGKDPLTAPLSSRPMEILESTGCADGDVVVWDANDNAELEAAAQRRREEGRAMVGPSGAVAAYAATVFPELKPRHVPVVPPVLILCGSLNAMSREQITRLGVPVFTLSDDLQLPSATTGSNQSPIAVVATPVPSGTISPRDAEQVAVAMAEFAHDALKLGYGKGTLIVLDGDTAAAAAGDETLDTAVPHSAISGRIPSHQGRRHRPTRHAGETTRNGGMNPYRSAGGLRRPIHSRADRIALDRFLVRYAPSCLWLPTSQAGPVRPCSTRPPHRLTSIRGPGYSGNQRSDARVHLARSP